MIIHCLAGGNYPMLDGDFFSPEFKHTDDILPPVVFFGPASAAGVVRYRSGAFGAKYQGNLFSVLFNMLKVQRHILERDGATFRARTEDFLVSQDPNFRPSDVIEDADGSLKPTRYKVAGSIFRIRRQGATPPEDPYGLKVPWERLTPQELARLLDDSRFVVRDRAINQLAKLRSGAISHCHRCHKRQSFGSSEAKCNLGFGSNGWGNGWRRPPQRNG